MLWLPLPFESYCKLGWLGIFQVSNWNKTRTGLFVQLLLEAFGVCVFCSFGVFVCFSVFLIFFLNSSLLSASLAGICAWNSQ